MNHAIDLVIVGSVVCICACFLLRKFLLRLKQSKKVNGNSKCGKCSGCH